MTVQFYILYFWTIVTNAGYQVPLRISYMTWIIIEDIKTKTI